MANVGSIASIEGGNYIETSDMQSKWEAVKVHADAVNANRAQANHQTSIPPATAEAAKSVSADTVYFLFAKGEDSLDEDGEEDITGVEDAI